MNNKDNSKVPIAILSCFLIAFVIQGSLKLGGILVFEKVLYWEIFSIIDNSKILQSIIYPMFTCLAIYCLSFSLTNLSYSKRWYHYIIIIIAGYSSTIYRTLTVNYAYQIDILLDVIIYIVVPFLITITNDKNNKLFKNDLNGIITSLAIHVFMFCGYLGLSYWSNLLTSLLPINPVYLSASTNFLIGIELYIGLILFMLSMNSLSKYIKEVKGMNRPFNMSTDEAKEKELEELEEVKEKDTKKK